MKCLGGFSSRRSGGKVAIKFVRTPNSCRGDALGYATYLGMPSSLRRLFVPTECSSVDGADCYIMPVADSTMCPGTADSVTLEALTLSIQVVCAALFALASSGFAYADIKPENIVVVRNRGGFNLAFCDLGSLAHLGSPSFATYPPPTHPSGLDVPATEAAMLWGLAALVAVLVGGHDSALMFSKDGKGGERMMAAMWRVIRHLGAESRIGRFLVFAARAQDGGISEGGLVDAFSILSDDGDEGGHVRGKRRKSEGTVFKPL